MLRPKAYGETLQTNLMQSLSTPLASYRGTSPNRSLLGPFRHGKSERAGCVGTEEIITLQAKRRWVQHRPLRAADPSYSHVEERN